LQKPQNDVRLNFRQTTKQATTVDRCRLKRATEVTSEFVAEFPHINTRSPRLQPGQFVISETERLLQHYLPISEVGGIDRLRQVG
jgi:hypothetical protein